MRCHKSLFGLNERVWRCLLAALAISLVRTAIATSPPPTFAGPFDVRQFIVFHVVNPSGEAFAINLRWREAGRAQMDRPILVRVFDPEEHVLIRHDAPGERSEQVEQTLRLDVPAKGAGVYQVAITGFRPTIEFAIEPTLSFGVFAYPELVVRDDQYADAFIHLPPTLETLTIRAGELISSVRVADEAGKDTGVLTNAGTASIALPAGGEHVWRLSARAPAGGGIGTLNFAAMPIILCPDEASARAIHSSVDVLDDGTICFHKFQVRAHEILKRYRAMPPSAFAVQPPVLIRHNAAWLKEPVRNRLLLGPYGVYSGLDVVLNEQMLMRESPWFGCIHSFRDANGRVRAENPWKTLDRMGLSRAAATMTTLAAVHSIDAPFNPLHRSETLRNRIIIAAMQELMMLREHELPHPEFIEYPGGERAFTFARFTLSFPLVVRDCPEDVRAVWTEGLQRYVDHQMLGVVNNTVNQWTFTIRGLQQFREGVDDPWYGEMVNRSLRWLLTAHFQGWGFMPAGYFAESGPDATYNGISLHNLGWVYRRTKDGELKEALRRCIDLFNHTVAPEPDGTWQEATNFASRTPDGWSRPQWSVGMTMLTAEIAETSPVMRQGSPGLLRATEPRAVRASEQQTNSMLTYTHRQAFRDFGEIVLTDAADIHFLPWQEFADQALVSELPILKSNTFTRVFGDEFMCVRRPSYYAFVYAGSPMDDWQKVSRATSPHTQYPRNGGGLSMFWSPEFGVSILAKNWSTYASQCVIVEREGGADWEDYWSVKPTFDAEHAVANVQSVILDQPIRVEREIRFLEEAVTCETTVTVDADGNGNAAWESFPYPLNKSRPLRVTLLDEQGRAITGETPASAIMFDIGGTQVHIVVFDRPRRCRTLIEKSVDHYNGQREHGCVLAEIPNGLSIGEHRVGWMIGETPTVGVGARVRTGIKKLNAP